MHNLQHEGVHAFLLQLIMEGPERPQYGICNAYLCNPYLPLTWLQRAFLHLGLDRDYPVPSGSRNADNQYAYLHTSAERMWDKGSRYGANRWTLLNTLADLAYGVQYDTVAWPFPETGDPED